MLEKTETTDNRKLITTAKSLKVVNKWLMKLGLPSQYLLDTAPVSMTSVVHASTEVEAVIRPNLKPLTDRRMDESTNRWEGIQSIPHSF